MRGRGGRLRGGGGGGSHCEAHDLQTWRPLGLGPKSPLLRRNIFQNGGKLLVSVVGGGFQDWEILNRNLSFTYRERRSLPGPADSRR